MWYLEYTNKYGPYSVDGRLVRFALKCRNCQISFADRAKALRKAHMVLKEARVGVFKKTVQNPKLVWKENI